MSIQVIEQLRATPSSFSLPRLVFLGQVLSSTRLRETCRFTYTLPAGNVCFRGGGKTAERTLEVARTATVIDHRLTLESCDGSPVDGSIVTLTQDVFDELGQRTRSRVRLTILGEQP